MNDRKVFCKEIDELIRSASPEIVNSWNLKNGISVKDYLNFLKKNSVMEELAYLGFIFFCGFVILSAGLFASQFFGTLQMVIFGVLLTVFFSFWAWFQCRELLSVREKMRRCWDALENFKEDVTPFRDFKSSAELQEMLIEFARAVVACEIEFDANRVSPRANRAYLTSLGIRIISANKRLDALRNAAIDNFEGLVIMTREELFQAAQKQN